MEKLKLMTILGTRPEIIRLSACLKAFDLCFDHILVHTGQNWAKSLNDVFFDDLEIRRPDYSLSCPGETLGDTMGNIISSTYRILQKEKPDALLVLGDTNSALSVISAKRLKIPIFHMEAGNRCFDLNVPEEINRRIVDHVSDINLAYTEHARRYLLAEGLPKEYIFVTGSPMTEVLYVYGKKINDSPILQKLNLEPGKYLVVSAHREENVDRKNTFIPLMEAINAVAETFKMPVIFSVHPRSAKRIKDFGFNFSPLVHCLEPLGFLDYCQLQKNSFCVLSDSGTLSEESSILGFWGVLLRTSTERPEALDKGSVIISGTRKEDILQAVKLSATMKTFLSAAASVPDYTDTNVSGKVVKIIQSYTEIINQNVWKKDSEYHEAEAGGKKQ